MKQKKLITISRQYGSGGREIGSKLAKRLQIAFYDKELIEMAAEKSGIDKELFSANEESAGGEIRYLGNMMNFLGNGTGSMLNLSLKDQMYITQCNLIEQLAEQESVVFVGRCADVVLQNHPGCINIFIHSNLENRKKRVIEEYGIDEKQALETIEKIDRKRKNYYEYYTDKKWGRAQNFHIVLDSSRFEIDKLVDMLVFLINSEE